MEPERARAGAKVAPVSCNFLGHFNLCGVFRNLWSLSKKVVVVAIQKKSGPFYGSVIFVVVGTSF